MKFTKIALGLLASSILFCGCTKDTDAVLKINDKEITKAEFYGDLDRIRKVQLQNTPKDIQKPTSYASLSIKNRYVNDVIVRELLSQEFEKRKIAATEDEIKAKKDALIKQVGSEENFKKIMQDNGITEEKLNSDMASEVKMDKLTDSLPTNKITDKDTLNYYKDNKDQFTYPQRVQASHILFNTNPENVRREIVATDKDGKLSQEEIEKKVKEEVARNENLAKDVRARAVANPKNFAKLAKEYSKDPGTAEVGGDLGYFTKEQMVPEFSQAAFSLKTGTISPLVKTQFGTHIIYVKDKAAAGTQSYSDIKADIKQFLIRKEKIRVVQELVDGLKNSAKIEYFDESIKPEVLKKELEEAINSQIIKMSEPNKKKK